MSNQSSPLPDGGYDWTDMSPGHEIVIAQVGPLDPRQIDYMAHRAAVRRAYWAEMEPSHE
jgi:hypothetical protein